MFIVKFTLPIAPNVVPLTVFTYSVFFMMSTLSEIFLKSWYKTEEHIAPVSNTAMIGSQP